jgi:hypothetical protein
MRVLLLQQVAPVEVPRSKAHRVEPVRPSMSVGGHSLTMCSILSRLARRHAATPGENAEQARGHGSKSVREHFKEPASAWAWTDVRFRPLFSWNLVPYWGHGMAQIGPFVPEPGPSRRP